MTNFWLSEAIRSAALFGVAWLLGRWVLRGGIRVNYTRKILHFILFFVPPALVSVLPFDGSLLTVTLSSLVFFAGIVIMSDPFRSRIPFLRTVFAAFDRPEDRPNTLKWLSTQILASYAVLIPVLAWLDTYGRVQLILITILVAGLGDGLAEPVGVRFGRHTYETRALFTDKRYTRSLEGSACVFLSGILAVFLFHGQLDGAEFLLALALIPAAMTLAEAWSPHTWDGPFLYLTGGAMTVAVMELAPLLR
jgi:phytol kinase